MSIIDINVLWADLLEIPSHRDNVGRAVPILCRRNDPPTGGFDVICARWGYAGGSTIHDVLGEALPRTGTVESPHQRSAVTSSDQRDIAPDPAAVVDGELEPCSEGSGDAAEVPLRNIVSRG